MNRIKSLTAFLLCLVLSLPACTEPKDYPPLNGGGYKPDIPSVEQNGLVGFEGKAEPIGCGKELVRRFIEIPQSNWGRTDAGKSPSSFVTYPDVCAYLGAFWFLEAAVDNAIVSGDDNVRTEALELMQGMVDKYNDVITGKTRYKDSKGNEKPLVTDLLWRHESNRVDYYIFGAISLHIASIMNNPKYSSVKFPQTKKEYLDFGLEYADNQWNPLTRAEFDARFNSSAYNHTGKLFKMSDGDWARWEKYIKDGYSWQTRLWIDDMFMITALQLQAWQGFFPICRITVNGLKHQWHPYCHPAVTTCPEELGRIRVPIKSTFSLDTLDIKLHFSDRTVKIPVFRVLLRRPPRIVIERRIFTCSLPSLELESCNHKHIVNPQTCLP